MKILHITPSYKPAYIYGGPIISVSRLCEMQTLMGNEVFVFTTTANGSNELNLKSSDEMLVDGVRVTYFPRITGDHTHVSPILWLNLWKSLKEYDVIHIHSWWNLLVLFSILICYIKGVKPVLSPRGMLTDYSFNHKNSYKKNIIHIFGGRFLLKKTFLHATSLLEWKVCQKILPGWHGFVAPNIVEIPDIVKSKNFDNEIFTLGTLSRLEPIKGFNLLFDSISKLNFPFLLRIAGDGSISYKEELKMKVHLAGLDKQVVWEGWKDGSDKYAYLESLDLFLVPSYTENFSVAAIESLLVGTPVLVSDQVGIFDIILEQNWGWVSKRNSSDFCTAMELIYLQKDERNRIRNEAPFQVKKYFDPESITKKYLDAYIQLL